MNEFLKNQRNAFFALVGGLLMSILLWYYAIHQGVQSSYETSKNQLTKIAGERLQYREMNNKLPSIESEWKSLNNTFENVLESIPYKQSYDHVSNTLFDLLLSKGLNVYSYLPSNVPIEKKNIIVPDSDQTILIEKYPIDVEMTGSYIQLGRFMDALKSMPYRMTASNIQIKKGKSKSSQNIKLIAYVYLQSGDQISKETKNIPSFKSNVSNTSSTQEKTKSATLGRKSEIIKYFEKMSISKNEVNILDFAKQHFNLDSEHLIQLAEQQGRGGLLTIFRSYHLGEMDQAKNTRGEFARISVMLNNLNNSDKNYMMDKYGITILTDGLNQTKDTAPFIQDFIMLWKQNRFNT
ncbi:MAG: type 4a pilus biogenesis protein PilO [Candidatus Marinimicrobia bacterium]|nr:type 4a pilus biogenesis protein PilO [Candidatus Neomarinimicrobiota bacterium]